MEAYVLGSGLFSYFAFGSRQGCLRCYPKQNGWSLTGARVWRLCSKEVGHRSSWAVRAAVEPL